METLKDFSKKAAEKDLRRVTKADFQATLANIASAFKWQTNDPLVSDDDLAKVTGLPKDSESCRNLACLAQLIAANKDGFDSFAATIPSVLIPLAICYALAVEQLEEEAKNMDDDDLAMVVDEIEQLVNEQLKVQRKKPSSDSFYVLQLPYVVRGAGGEDKLVIKVGITKNIDRRLKDHEQHFDRHRCIKRQFIEQYRVIASGIDPDEVNDDEDVEFRVPRKFMTDLSFDNAKRHALKATHGKVLEQDLNDRLEAISAFEFGEKTVTRAKATQPIAAAAFGLKNKGFGYNEIYVVSKTCFKAMSENFSDHQALLGAIDAVLRQEDSSNSYIQLEEGRRINFGRQGAKS